MNPRARMIRNFIERHGEDRLRWLIEAFARGESGQVIADELRVSRERVRQWKHAFGQVIHVYQVHPEVRRALDADE